MDAAVGENDNPPPEDEAEDEQSDFDRAIAQLERNQCDQFWLREVGERMTIPQAKSVSDALHKNTSVIYFAADMEFCPLSTTGLFVEYIRSNQLLEVSVDYVAGLDDNEETQQCYRAQLDRVFQAVRENPYIQLLNAESFGNPLSIYELLANNSKSLNAFRMLGVEPTSAIAKSIGIGMSKNTHIKILAVGCRLATICVSDFILSGLSTSSVEELQLWPRDFDENLQKNIWKLLFYMPTLKKLCITDSTSNPGTGGHLGEIFLDVRHPACNLKSLFLEEVLLAASADKLAPSNSVPIKEANSGPNHLTLMNVCFETPRAVRLLWNLTGLKIAAISSPTYASSSATVDASQHLEYDWIEFFRRNKDLVELQMQLSEGVDRAFLHGGLVASGKHNSLKKLVIDCNGFDVQLSGDSGSRLSRALQEKETPLKEFILDGARARQEFVTFLVTGLCHSSSLQILRCENCAIEAHAVVEILGSLLVNKTLAELSFQNLSVSEPLNRDTFCQTLSQVFGVNESLAKLTVSRMDLRDGAMSESLAGLHDNKSLETLIFDQCRLDNAAMASLVQTLESTSNGLLEIGIPKNTTNGEVDDIKEGTKVVLESLVGMPKVQKVHFGHTMADFDDESLALLLQAAKENKNLTVLDGCEPSQPNVSLVMAEIKYYLKLNRFGRRLLDSPNVPAGLWPRILVGMTAKPEHADALFFFIRECFSRQTQKDNESQVEPPTKKARVE